MSRSVRLGYFPNIPGLDRATHDEHRGGRAVIGPVVRVFNHAASELAECHQHDPLKIALLFQVSRKCGESRIQFAEQPVVGVNLARVSVESSLTRVIHARWETAGDHPRDNVQARCELPLGIGHG